MGLPVELSIPSISTFAAMLLVCAVTPREIFCNQFAQSNCCLRAEFLRGLKKIYRYDERHFAPKAVCRVSQLYDCKARGKRLRYKRAMQTRTPPPVVASAKQLDVRVGHLTHPGTFNPRAKSVCKKIFVLQLLCRVRWLSGFDLEVGIIEPTCRTHVELASTRTR